MDGRSKVSVCKAWWTRPVIPRPRLPRSEKFHSAHLGRFVFHLYDKVCRIGKFYIIFFPKVMLCNKRLPLTLYNIYQIFISKYTLNNFQVNKLTICDHLILLYCKHLCWCKLSLTWIRQSVSTTLLLIWHFRLVYRKWK